MGTLLIIIFFLLLPTFVICFLAILEEKRKKQIKKEIKKTIGQLAKKNKLQVGQIYFSIVRQYQWIEKIGNSYLLIIIKSL